MPAPGLRILGSSLSKAVPPTGKPQRHRETQSRDATVGRIGTGPDTQSCRRRSRQARRGSPDRLVTKPSRPLDVPHIRLSFPGTSCRPCRFPHFTHITLQPPHHSPRRSLFSRFPGVLGLHRLSRPSYRLGPYGGNVFLRLQDGLDETSPPVSDKPLVGEKVQPDPVVEK